LQLRPLFGRGFIAGVDAKEQVKRHRMRLEEVIFLSGCVSVCSKCRRAYRSPTQSEKQRKYLSRLASNESTDREREVVQQQLTKLKKDEVCVVLCCVGEKFARLD
jgi:hypothetical protein